MLFKGNSSKLELLIGKIQANSITPKETDTLGTSLSWGSEENSLSPSSCPTPTSQSGQGEGQDLTWTIGPTETTPYPCQFCDKSFPRLSYLKKHEQSHSDQMPFSCNFCNRLFKHKRSRDRHVKLHTGDKKYRCIHCESAFSRSDHLKIHMKTHDHQKPYQCVVCNRGYNTAAALTSHMQNHKKESIQSTPSPGPFRCLQCTGSFMTGEELQTHVLHNHPMINPPPNSLEKSENNNGTHHNNEGSGGGKRRHNNNNINHGSSRSSPSSKTPSPRDQKYQQQQRSHEMISNDQQMRSQLLLPYGLPKLACIYCTKDSFQSFESLQLHVQAMHGPLLMNGDLIDHNLNNNHLISPGNESQISPEISPSSQLGQALSQAAAGLLTCSLCTMKFGNLQMLHKHAMSVHSLTGYLEAKAKENAFCAQCSLAFPNSIAFAEHFLLFHANPMRKPPTPSQICSPEPPQIKPTDLSLSSSRKSKNESSSTPPASKKHRNNNDNNNSPCPSLPSSSPIIDQNFGPNSLMTQFLLSKGLNPQNQYSFPPSSLLNSPSLLCNQCNAGFSDFESFRTHLKSHLEQVVRKFVCDECEAEFGSEDQLEGHVMGHYLTQTTEYGCQSCLKLFGKPDELQKHLMDIHAHHLYRCSLCKEMFDSKVSIQVHFAVKHSNECKLYRCTTCTTIFRSEIEFQIHVKMAHLRKVSPYRCLLCSASFSNEMDLQFHLQTHQKQFRCKLCEESFYVEFLLDKHMQTHHSSIQFNNTTGSNDTENSGKTNKNHSPQNNNNTNTNSKSNSGKKDKTSKNQNVSGSKTEFKCDICDKTMANECEHDKHRKLVHYISPGNNSKFPGQGSGKVVNSNGVNPNINGKEITTTNSQLSLSCAYCNETCKSRSDLEAHMKTHQIQSSGKNKCNICDELFPTPTLLAEHKLSHCKVLSGSVCTLCKCNITSEEHFYIHMKQHAQQQQNPTTNNNNNSNGLPPVTCIVCRQTLMTDIEVHLHAKFHTKSLGSPNLDLSQVQIEGQVGQVIQKTCVLCLRIKFEENSTSTSTNYICTECFTQKTTGLPKIGRDRENHRDQDFSSNASSNGDTGDGDFEGKNTQPRSYQCIKCQMSFKNEQDVREHVTSHLMNEGSSHPCQLCSNLSFESPLKLQCHLIEHTFEGSSTYTCYMCSSVFTTSSKLQLHMVEHGLHTRPYDCNLCHLKFFFRAELENHLVCHEEIKKAIIELPPGQGQGQGQNHQQNFQNFSQNSNSNNSTSASAIKNSSKRPRKRFFYRSDDSDEEMESVGSNETCYPAEVSGGKINGQSAKPSSIDGDHGDHSKNTDEDGDFDGEKVKIKMEMVEVKAENDGEMSGENDKIDKIDISSTKKTTTQNNENNHNLTISV